MKKSFIEEEDEDGENHNDDFDEFENKLNNFKRILEQVKCFNSRFIKLEKMLFYFIQHFNNIFYRSIIIIKLKF